jgi:hypothetical protein
MRERDIKVLILQEEYRLHMNNGISFLSIMYNLICLRNKRQTFSDKKSRNGPNRAIAIPFLCSNYANEMHRDGIFSSCIGWKNPKGGRQLSELFINSDIGSLRGLSRELSKLLATVRCL